MFQLLQPIWMFTATAISMPLVIHIWSLRKGKRLKIGSLLLIHESVQPTARQLRITEWLLLLLRCLIIVLLALFLSKPYWNGTSAHNSEKGWVMIPEESAGTLYPVYKKQVDSLLEAGHEFHYFNFPFRQGSPEKTAADSSDRTSYRHRLLQLTERLPAGFPVYIFSDGSMDHFAGKLPVSDLSIRWQLSPVSSNTTRLLNAYRFGTDSIGLRFITSNGGGSYFVRQHIAANTTDKEIRVQRSGAISTVQFRNTAPVPVDTSTFRITVYQKGYRDDAVYITAALEAIRPLFDGSLEVISVTNPAAIPAGQDWVFWLSDELLTATNAQTNYFAYTPGKMEATATRIILTDDDHATLSASVLHKRIGSQDTVASKIIWRDGFGHPVLAKRTGSSHYRFYSRFNPAWTNMVWEASFPELLFSVLRQDSSPIVFADNRQTDTAQLFIPATTPVKKTIAGSNTDLSAVCWWLLLACLIAERWLSLQNKTKARAA